ncbi:hypothetical protein TNCV_3333121 [Trichonephila clavipes]|nr:hypothetical protein TNCV_3333121 [Trichonephila clavipes]
MSATRGLLVTDLEAQSREKDDTRASTPPPNYPDLTCRFNNRFNVHQPPLHGGSSEALVLGMTHRPQITGLNRLGIESICFWSAFTSGEYPASAMLLFRFCQLDEREEYCRLCLSTIPS